MRGKVTVIQFEVVTWFLNYDTISKFEFKIIYGPSQKFVNLNFVNVISQMSFYSTLDSLL